MSYTALARRYRSQAFDEVVGQEPIAQTLGNAVAGDRLHHAYLFCGTRGVGKTTMARLLARALNAPQTMTNLSRPKGVAFPPVDVQQRMADAIMRGDDLNVIEIDGASNRGVDDARQLIANAGLAPTDQARFKVYIIDEVHMLTREAFNALLKTMEEPPAHLKFILCTTEAHKVLPTIISRCQRFDFRPIPVRSIGTHLKAILEKEGHKADEALLLRLGRLSGGSMRDALSLLERILASGESPLTMALAERLLGLPSQTMSLELVEAIAAADPAGALRTVERILGSGTPLDQLIQALVDHLRNVLVISACGPECEWLELDEETRRQALAQAQRLPMASLVHMIALLESVYQHSRFSALPRALFEAAITRLCLSGQFALLRELLTDGSPARAAGGTQKKTLVALPDPVVPTTPAPLAKASPSFAPAPAPAPALSKAPASAPALSKVPASAPALSKVPASAPARAPVAPGPRPALAGPTGSRSMPQADRDRLLKQPLVAQVLDLFDARLVNVRPAGPEGPICGVAPP